MRGFHHLFALFGQIANNMFFHVRFFERDWYLGMYMDTINMLHVFISFTGRCRETSFTSFATNQAAFTFMLHGTSYPGIWPTLAGSGRRQTWLCWSCWRRISIYWTITPKEDIGQANSPICQSASHAYDQAFLNMERVFYYYNTGNWLRCKLCFRWVN